MTHPARAATPERARGRIVFLIPSLTIGGAQRQLIELAAGMQQAGWQVKVLTFYPRGALEVDLLARGVSIQSLEKRSRWDVLGFSVRLVRQLRRERPHILHGYLGTPNLVAVLVKPLVPGMRTVWGVRASDMDMAKDDWLARLLFRVECRLARFADLIICNSVSGRDFHMTRGYPAQRMVVVPNGIDSERFKPDAEGRATLRREWRVGDDELLVGLVGRLAPKKDHPTFLRAAAQVFTGEGRIRFVSVGDDPRHKRGSFEHLASRLGLNGHLIWAESRLDMPQVYSALDLAVSSSSWGEGFPNVVAEAMATGVPCVVTDVGDSAYVVGDAGWVCPPSDPVELAGAIWSALSSRETLQAKGARARQRVLAEFSVERLVLSTSEHLSRLVVGLR